MLTAQFSKCVGVGSRVIRRAARVAGWLARHGLWGAVVLTWSSGSASAQLYDFNAGNIAYGWTLAGAYVDANNPCSALTPVADNLTGMFWSDTTNYPTAAIGKDPDGDAAGAIRFDTSLNGDGVAGPGSYWYVLLTSPDLSRLRAWMHVYGVRVRLMTNMGPGTNFANVIVRVHDLDQQRDRCFFSGNLNAITKSSWTTWTLDWSGISTFPARYTLLNVYVDVAGELIQTYTSGSVWVDNVEGLVDPVAPAVAITGPTSATSFDTLAATVDLAGTAVDSGGSTLARVSWSNAATGASGTATGTTNWSVSGVALAPGANTITVTAMDKAQNTGTDQIQVNLLPPGAFNKTAPPNGATGLAPDQTLSWGTSSGATAYAYCYDTTNDNACSAWTSTGTSTSVGLKALTPGATYYWQARATGPGGTTYANAGAIAFWSFTVTPLPAAFGKSSPANGATGAAANPTLSWGASSGAASYAYCYDTSNDGACSTWTGAGTSTSAALSGLAPGATYYWHARATNAAGTTYANGSATAFWSFTVAASTYTLAVQRSGSGLGTVTSTPAGITCGRDCSEPYPRGAQVTLRATASLGSAFAGWTGCPAPSANQCAVTITSAHTVTATFARLGTTRRIQAGKPSLSGNGRYLAFVSTRTDLVEGDTNGHADIFVRETISQATVRVSVGTSRLGPPVQANAPSDAPSISADGRYVAFTSEASNLVPGDTNGVADVFLHDRDADADRVFDEPGAVRTLRVSVASTGAQASAACGQPDLSPDGLWVVFASTAGTLAPGDRNGLSDVFLHHWPSGATWLVSAGPDGVGNGPSVWPAVSARADVVVFASDATNFDDADSNGVRDVFRWERATRRLVRLTGAVDEERPQANGPSDRPDISSDGRVVAFQTLATNLAAAADTNRASDIIVLRPRPLLRPAVLAATVEPPRVSASGVVSVTDLLRQLASQAASGDTTGNGASTDPAVSGDGSEVVYSSEADDLDEPGTDDNDGSDIYVSDEGAEHPALVPDDDASTPAGSNGEPTVSEDGSHVAFEQQSSEGAEPEVLVTGPTLMVTGLAPASGLVTGGFQVVISGAGFSDAAQITIGGRPAGLAAVSSGQEIVVTVPDAAAPATVDVTVTVGTETHTLAGAFTYLPLPPDEPPVDYDGDTLPDTWETQFGLDPLSASGDAGAGGDPDRDGRTNAEEWLAGSHPNAVFTRYFAEGATAPLFEVDLAVTNPEDRAATVLLRLQRADGTERAHLLPVPPRASRSVRVGPLPDMASREFSTVVESDVPVVADRLMTWDRPTAYGSHLETAVTAPALTWYLAEGATHSGFDLFYLLQNPNTTEARVRVRYLRPAPAPPLERTLTLPPTSRTNIWVDYETFEGESPAQALANTDVSAVIDVLNAVPIIVERAMYLTRGGVQYTAGHESAGVTAPSTRWFLAEGSTQAGFDLFVLVANPSPADADIEVQFLLSDGTVVIRPYVVAAESRFNVWVNLEGPLLQDQAISTIVTSTNDVPVIVERAMWWPRPAWHEGHNSPGTIVTGTAWAIAAGEVTSAGAAADTFVLVANTSEADGDVLVTLLFEDDTPPVARTFRVTARSRLTVNVRAEFPEALGRRFGAIVESVGETPPQIVVERALYTDAGGVHWAAGGNSLATRLR